MCGDSVKTTKERMHERIVEIKRYIVIVGVNLGLLIFLVKIVHSYKVVINHLHILSNHLFINCSNSNSIPNSLNY